MRYTGGTPILKFLSELDSENYPYDMVQIRYTLGDNGGPDTDMPEFVREWNAEYEYPKFRIATTQEMFQDFEKKYASKIPTHRGDFSPYWAKTAPLLLPLKRPPTATPPSSSDKQKPFGRCCVKRNSRRPNLMKRGRIS